VCELVQNQIESNQWIWFDSFSDLKDSKPISSKFQIISSSILNHSPLVLSSLYHLSPILYQRISIFIHARALIHRVSYHWTLLDIFIFLIWLRSLWPYFDIHKDIKNGLRDSCVKMIDKSKRDRRRWLFLSFSIQWCNGRENEKIDFKN